LLPHCLPDRSDDCEVRGNKVTLISQSINTVRRSYHINSELKLHMTYLSADYVALRYTCVHTKKLK